MAYLNVDNSLIRGVTVCIPKNIVSNWDYEMIPKEEREKFINGIGIEKRHITDGSTTTSDLCFKAAEHLLDELQWDKSDIELLVFISQTPDYKMPATSCVLQDRLGLPLSCMTIDISQGCSGYVYGLSIVSSLLQTGTIKKALLLTGNTQSKNVNYEDQSAYPLFGDAGSATAIEFSEYRFDEMKFHFATDGSGANTIIIPDGGYRNPVTPESFKIEEFNGGIKRNRLNLKMEGDDTFSFVISEVPKAINRLFNYYDINKNDLDYYLLHHASKFTCERLRKKMKLEVDKTPLVLREYGNSSNASIPLLFTTTLRDKVKSEKLRCMISGFGVGLSLGVGVISIGNLVCSDLIMYE